MYGRAVTDFLDGTPDASFPARRRRLLVSRPTLIPAIIRFNRSPDRGCCRFFLRCAERSAARTA